MAKQALLGRVYQDRDGGWRWQLRAHNGEQVSQGEAYTRKADAVRGLRRVAPRVAIDLPLPLTKGGR